MTGPKGPTKDVSPKNRYFLIDARSPLAVRIELSVLCRRWRPNPAVTRRLTRLNSSQLVNASRSRSAPPKKLFGKLVAWSLSSFRSLARLVLHTMSTAAANIRLRIDHQIIS